ncbi:MAG: GH32 C-terminal domain-containing protein, partial [Prevotella sp.]|nr:GH32 C-terminal domain-containing protein [Prevotella sp.]
QSLVAQTVVGEIDKVAGQWQAAGSSFDMKDAYQLRIKLNLDKNSTITLSNANGEKYVMEVSANKRTIAAHRTSQTGKTAFNGSFSVPSTTAPLNTDGSSVTLDIYVDQSSVELLTENGAMSMTNLVFPTTIYNQLTVEGADSECQVRELKRIWK